MHGKRRGGKYGLVQNHPELRYSRIEDIAGVLKGIRGANAQKRAAGIADTPDKVRLITEGNVGRTVTLPPDDPQPVTILNIDGPTDGFGDTMTLTLSKPETPSVNGTVPTIQDPFQAARGDARVEVLFGIGGFVAKAYFDITQGYAFPVPASFLRVNVLRVTGPFDSAINVGAHVSLGNVSIFGGVPRLLNELGDEFGQLLADTAFSTSRLPPFCSRVFPVVRAAGTNQAPVAGEVQVQFSRGARPTGLNLFSYDDRRPIPTIEVPAQSETISVQNLTGADIRLKLSYEIVF